MAANKRTQIQIERDRRQIADWYLQGWKQAEIAEKINEDDSRDYTLTQQMVSYDIGVLVKSWRESGLADIDDAKAQELARINHLEVTYWNAWLRSCEDTETVRQRGQPGDTPGQVHTSTVERTRKGQAGDPRFLTGIQWCIEQRCKIFGVYATTKVQHSGTGKDGEIEVKQVGLNPEEAKAAMDAFYHRVLAEIRERHPEGDQSEEQVRASRDAS